MREASIIVAAFFVALYSYCSVHQQKNEKVAIVAYYRVLRDYGQNFGSYQHYQ